MSGPGTFENPRDQSGASIPGDAAPIPQVTYGHARTQKRLKQRPNPLFVNPLSALSAEVCARFPTELHDYIIDHLHNDKRALLACSLVSNIWSTSSRYHLFQNACTIHVDRRNFRQFCELLATQRLNIYIGRLHLKSHVIDERFAGGPNETFQFNDHLHLLAGLPSLKYLCLEYHHDSLLPGFFAAIAQNFAGVTDLEFSSMHFDAFSQFVEILDLLPCLRRVALNGVLWYDVDSDSDSEEDATLPTYMPGPLADFVANCRFQHMAPVLHWLRSQPSLRRLAIAMGASSYINPDTALVSDVLRALSGSLEHLIVCDAPHAFVPDLSCLTVLRTLEIAGIQPLPHNSRDDFQWVPALLSLLNSPVLAAHSSRHPPPIPWGP
ncbi:hypothetical protein B0H14DRAFT_698567 [Mycena olivaceomarginata]|nr:hypothetical protein B0H14DRAFT_698567 [Mycena olivaceomarginata]